MGREDCSELQEIFQPPNKSGHLPLGSDPNVETCQSAKILSRQIKALAIYIHTYIYRNCSWEAIGYCGVVILGLALRSSDLKP